MTTIRSVRLIINRQTAIVTALSVVSTFVCRRYGVLAEFPLTLIATAIVFPIVFSIGGAYKRREAALDRYGDLKAHGRAIYFAARDWIDEPPAALLAEVADRLRDLLVQFRELLHAPKAEMPRHERSVYAGFSELSRTIRRLRAAGLTASEVSRVNQYLSKAIVAFENAKHIYQYRTPRTLRAYSKLFIYVLPIVYGPYFAAISLEYTQGLAYAMPVLFSVILVCLDNIQDHLENPFDQVGEDDILINAEKFVEGLAS